MLKTQNGTTASGDGGSVDYRLARVLDTPHLARVVPHLPAETLQQLIRWRGLESSGEIVMSATPAQLNSLFDLDLWRSTQPGRDGEFDADRFGEWLEVLVETGESVAARIVAGLDQQVVVNGLSRYIRVLDPGIFEPIAQSDDEMPDREEALREGDFKPQYDPDGGRLETEVGGYMVRARRTDAWDAIVTLLVALETEYSNHFHAVMDACRLLSNSNPESDGLDDLLLEREQAFHDAATERESRLSQQGYATPADARAFLLMARRPRPQAATKVKGKTVMNPIAAAYFRAADEVPGPAAQSPETSQQPLELPVSMAAASSPAESPAEAADVADSVAAVIELLTEAGMMRDRPRALLAAADESAESSKLKHVRELMDRAAQGSEIEFFERNRELAFLTNVLIAGCSVQSRPFTPPEASDAVASICNLGLEVSGSPDGDHVLITAFEVGWSVLYRDVSLFVAQELLAVVKDLRSVDRDIQRGIVALRRQLARDLEAGTPWLARDAADVLSMLDMTTSISVRGLLAECPVMAATLTAILRRSKTTVDSTAFGFISTTAEIEDVRAFMKKLPDLLLE